MTTEQLYQIYLRHPSIRTDTRQLKQGDLYFALKGPNFNGNSFAARALELGAAYAIIDEAVTREAVTGEVITGEAVTGGSAGTGKPAGAVPNYDNRLIRVPDVLQALQDLALYHRRQFRIPFIAITGSNGKTTTKELIHAVLAAAFITYTTAGNLNNHIGIPLTILSVKTDAQFAVIEMGANHQGEIEGYCRYTLPTHGVITNVGKAHLEGFGGPEGVRKGKGELYDFLRSGDVPAAATTPGTTAGKSMGETAAGSMAGGAAFVMWDYDYFREMSRGVPQIITYGTSDADYTGIIRGSDGGDGGELAPPAGAFLHVEITRGAATGLIHTQLVGDYNLPNVLAAVAIGKHFGVPDEKIKAAIERYAPSNSRSQMIERDGNHIILDAYNANPSSMKAAIENFARIQDGATATADKDKAGTGTTGPATGSDGGKVLILGAMAELGTESLEEHRGIVDLIGRYPWQQVVLVGGDFQRIDHPYRRFADSRAAADWFRRAGLKNTYILIKGSRSSKMEEVLEKGESA